MKISPIVLETFAAMLGKPTVVYDRKGDSPYLSRYYLTSRRDDEREEGSDRAVNVFLHRFHRGDDDVALHNHPWGWGFSLILSGGYREELRAGDEVVTREFRPGDVNFLTHETYHRVELLEDECWTLFVAGPKTTGSWGFWDRETKRRAHWRQFIDEVRTGEPAEWIDDRREQRVLVVTEAAVDALHAMWPKLEELMRVAKVASFDTQIDRRQLTYRPIADASDALYVHDGVGDAAEGYVPIAETPVTTQYRAAMEAMRLLTPIVDERVAATIDQAEAAAALTALRYMVQRIAKRVEVQA